MQKINITQEKLFTLKEGLKWGDQKEIADKLGVSQSLVNMVLSGAKYNARIIEVALDLYEREQKRKEIISEKLNQL